MNDLTRYEINFKQYINNIEIFNNKTILNYLIDLINLESSNKRNEALDLYILLNISNLFKEIDIVKTYTNNNIFGMFVDYLLNLDFSVNFSENYKLNLDQKEVEMILNKTLIYELLLNILGNIILNAKEKAISSDLIIKSLENTMSIFGEITSFNGKIPKKVGNDDEKKQMFKQLMIKTYDEIFYSICGFIHFFLISKSKQIFIGIYVIEFILKFNKMIYEFLAFNNSDSIHISFITMLYDISSLILNVKMEEFNIDNLKLFLDSSKEYLKFKEKFPLITEIMENMLKINEKIKIYNEKNNLAAELD